VEDLLIKQTFHNPSGHIASDFGNHDGLAPVTSCNVEHLYTLRLQFFSNDP
jgi:hypothetical protein